MKQTHRLAYRALAPWIVGAVAFLAGALQTLVYGAPTPAVHDEFSYLLAADTFVHGRCTNPPHPLWQHFETMHVLQQPTYASKYPPGQGLFLAAGRLVGGHAIVGVWLGVALACAAITWMLQACLPFVWAVIGGLLAASQLGFGVWGDCYWGGGVAAAGGAMFVGGWFRVMRHPKAVPAALSAAGLTLLANSRPFEGLLLCVPIGIATLVQVFRLTPARRWLLAKCLVPAGAVLVPSACALGYYNARVTGDPLRLPYLLHTEQYVAAPFLWIVAPRPEPEYRHADLRDFYVGWELETYKRERTREGWSRYTKAKLQMWWGTYLGYGLTCALIVLPCVLLASPRTRFAMMACVFVLGLVATVETWGFPHYVAPAAGLIYFILMQCFRYASLLRFQSWPVGRWVAATCVILSLLAPARSLLSVFHQQRRPWGDSRAETEQRLREDGNRHLVIVRYGSGHSTSEEWVFNEADVDASAVVWAREMGEEGRARLLGYFQDRVVWLLEDDGSGPKWTRLREPIKTVAAEVATRK
jgi:hypothetical protein